MAATEQDLMRRLDALGIPAATRRHEPLFTVEDGRHLHEGLPGAHCKSLFLKDKKGALWLVVALHDTRVDLKALQKALGAARFSFGKPDLLMEVLGVTPGAVTPFALINAEGGARGCRPERNVVGGARRPDAGPRHRQLPPADQRRDDGHLARRPAAVHPRNGLRAGDPRHRRAR